MPRVLIVEPSAQLYFVWRGLLELDGSHEIRRVQDAQGAMEKISTGPREYDLVIISLELSGEMQGDELSCQIRRLNAIVPILLLASDTPAQHEATMVAFRPILLGEFRAAVASLLPA